MTNLLKTYPALALMLGVVSIAVLTTIVIVFSDRSGTRASSEPHTQEPPSFKAYTTAHEDAKKTRALSDPSHQKPELVTETTPPQQEQDTLSATTPPVEADLPPSEPQLAELIIVGGEDTPFGSAAAIPERRDVPDEPLVMGPDHWRATLPYESKQKLDVEIEQRQRLVNAALELHVREHDLRRGAGQLVQERSWGCYQQLLRSEPDASGRLQVAVQIIGEAGVGTIQHARIKSSVYLKQRSLHDCIVRSLIGATFDTTAASHTILNTEYPVGLPTLEL